MSKQLDGPFEMKDIFNDHIEVEAFGLVTSVTFVVADMDGKTTEVVMDLTPKKARKLAKALKRAAEEVESGGAV